MPATVRKEDRFRSAGVRGISLCICLVSAALAVSFPAAASKPQVIISPVVRAEISTASDFHVHIDRPTPLPADSILVITGLPKSVTFSTGSAITTGIWEVPLAGLKNLKIVVSAVEASRSDLSLYLAIKKKDRLVVLASARSILLVEASTGKDRQAVTKEAEDARLTETKSAQKTTSEQKTTGEGPGDLAIPSVRRLMEGHLSSPAPETTDKRKPVAKKTEDERIAERIKQAKGAVEEARQQLVTKQAEMERLAAEALKIEQARKAEEARAEEARRQAAAKQAETERLAAEALKIEQARKAEEARAEEARRQAAAKQAETEQLAVEALKVEQARKAEEARAEEARRQAAAKQAETEQLAVEALKVEQARKAEEARAEEARRQAAAKQAETERLAAEALKIEQARKAEEARAEEARRQAAAKQAETERLAAEALKIEQARKAEEARAEEARRQAAAKQAETERLAAEALKIEQARKAEEARAEEARRQAAAKQAETERLAAEALKIEQARKAEEARAEEARRQAAAKQAEIKLIDATGVEKAGERNTDKAKQSQIASPKDSSPMGALRVEPPEGESQQKPAIAQSERLVSRGDEYLSQGNFAVAREYFLRAARSGLAIAALKLGETYDPHELGRMNVQGLVPDSAEARKWYTKALQLGSGEAQLKLGRLGGN